MPLNNYSLDYLVDIGLTKDIQESSVPILAIVLMYLW